MQLQIPIHRMDFDKHSYAFSNNIYIYLIKRPESSLLICELDQLITIQNGRQRSVMNKLFVTFLSS